MFRWLLIFVAMSWCLPRVTAQTSPMDLREDISWCIRGKAIGFFIVEDIYFLTATLGLEVTLQERHSIGVDATWFRWRNEYDDIMDNALYSNYRLRKYFLIDYKYTIGSIRSIDFYANAYDKIGWYKMWYKGIDVSTYTSTEFLKSRMDGTFNEFGFGIGARRMFGESNFGVDCSANVKKVYSNNDDFRVLSDGTTIQAYNLKTQDWGFYMRLNLFVLLI